MAKALFKRHALCLGNEHQILAGSHLAVNGRLLGEIADVALCLDGFIENIMTVNLDLARGGGKTAREYVHSGRFARTVRAEQTVYLSGLDVERDIVNGKVIAVLFS